MDLIQIIEDNIDGLYEINGLLTQLNKLEAHDSIVSFILISSLFLEQLAKNVWLKKEYAKTLDWQTNVMSQ